ncbi:MAG: hypothetical protein HOG49_36980 [Candidatus Scalindua sp.]|mgnify:FL=1|jgi:hypothetical protein|nr:hypothetical protein [Candidatus Scalindua sp.]
MDANERVLDQTERDARVHFIDTLMANVDNKRLYDEEFREFVRCSLSLFTPTVRVEELRKEQNGE